MPTTKVTSFVCLMLTAALLWSSFGTSIMSAPVQMDINGTTVNQENDFPNEPQSETLAPAAETQKPYFGGGSGQEGDNRATTSGGWYYEPDTASWGNWSFRDAQNVPEAENLGYTGDGVTVALADTGIDFNDRNLQGKYSVDTTTYEVTNVSVVAASATNQTNVTLPHAKIVDGTLKILLNGTLTTTGYTVDYPAGEIKFNTALPLGSSVVCSYSHRPYYNWPVAFDALGLPQYLLSKEAEYGNGGVANTSLNGTGPFDLDHTVNVDGKPDFLRNEIVGTDKEDMKPEEFDLSVLYATRDDTFWYAGTKTLGATVNRTFGFSFDFDGPATGSVNDPRGNLLDFEASHSAPVEQVSFDPNNELIATCAAAGSGDAFTYSYEKNSVKIWDQNSNLVNSLPNEENPVTSVIWSPDGSLLAYQTTKDVVVYETATWTQYLRMAHSLTPVSNSMRETMAFSPNGTMLVVGALQSSNSILFINMISKQAATYSDSNINTPRALAYSPDESKIAMGQSDGWVRVIDSTSYAEVISFVAPGLFDVDNTGIETLAWGPDGKHIATGRGENAKGMVDIWNLTSSNNRLQWGGDANMIEFSDATFDNLNLDRFYLRGIANEVTVNGLTAYQLGNYGSNDLQLSPTMESGGTHTWGMRVWVRTAAGAETELTPGVADAIITRNTDDTELMTPTTLIGKWTPAQTPLNPTDSIVIKIYQDRDVPIPTTLVATFTSGQLGTTQLNSTEWSVNYQTRRSSALGAIETRMTGHSSTSAVNAVTWTSGNIISAGSDGKIIFWNPTAYTIVNSRNSRDNSPILSFAMNSATGDFFVATQDCTVRKYPSTWSAYSPFVGHKPDVMVYIPYEREYYIETETGKKLDVFDHIEDAIVYRWDQSTSAWFETNMTNIFGKVFYKGNLAGEWTANGFIEIGLPRNLTAWPDQNEVFINTFICGNNVSRPQDTVPADCNVPTKAGLLVNWTGTRKVTLSSWGKSVIPKVTIDHASIPSARAISDRNYHFGYHPSTALSNLYGALVPMIVVESATIGTWDRVYVDMNQDYTIDSTDSCVYRDSPELYIDDKTINGTASIPGPDGIPDISGGLLYFIGDGKTKMPYSDRMSEVLMASGDQLTPFNVDNPMPIPKNGEIVAFYGELDFDDYNGQMQTHGTQMASAIAGNGVIIGEFGPVKGVSTDVTFLPICNAHYNLEYALYFAVEGYDGTPNTGDEAQIVSLGQYYTGYGSGLDEASTLIEYLVNTTRSNAVFISPAGNDGSGYGTVASPCSVNTLVVGFAEDNTFVSGGGDIHHEGAVSELSSRGPTAAGLSKPDVVALGMGDVDLPLGTTGSLATAVGGQKQTVLWKSSDLASAVTTGVMALIYEAYKDEHGTYPTTQIAMDIIRSSAKDLGYDPLTQGAGFVDALAAVRTARGDKGLIASAQKTSFGDTFGVSYGSFINVLRPGDNDSIPITVQNPTAGTQTPIYNFDYLNRIDIQEFYTPVPNTLDGFKGDITQLVPVSAEEIKVTAQTNFSWYVPWLNGTGYDYKTFLTEGGSFSLKLWDWVDAQPIGTSGHGVIDATELSYLAGSDYGGVNSMVCSLSNPHGSLKGNLVVEVASVDIQSTVGNRNWKITIESFASAPTSWITLDKTGATIANEGSDTVNAIANVPANAQAGTYAGAFRASYDPLSGTFAQSVPYTARSEQEYLKKTLESTPWDDGNTGNYWDDYTTRYPTAGNDGTVWDTAYTFNTPGKADNYPLIDPADTYSDARVTGSPITVADNSEFASYATAGNGSAGNPWLIENLIIDGYSQNGIDISNTDDYFIIRNCEIYNLVGSSGIYLSAVQNGAIIGCYLHDNGDNGIAIFDYSSNILIQDCTISNNVNYAVNTQYSGGMNIDGNIISTNGGAIVLSGEGNTIAGNEISDNGVAVEMYDGDNIITGNYIHDNYFGILAFDDNGLGVSNLEITWNSFANFTPDWAPIGWGDVPTGLVFWMDSTVDTLVNNNDFVNCDGGVGSVYVLDSNGNTNWDSNYWFEYTDVDAGGDGVWDTPYTCIDVDMDGIADIADSVPWVSPVSEIKSYYVSSAPIIISDDADFTTSAGVVNPGAAGTPDDPYIISGWDINSTGFANGIKISNTSAYYVIMNCRIYGNAVGNGIMIYNAPNGTVRSNDIRILTNGILIENTQSSLVSYNILQVTGIGISLKDSDMSSAVFNSIEGGTHGIYADSSYDCIISLNDVTGTSQSGITAIGSDWVIIENNRVTDAVKDGILLKQSDNGTLIYNNLDSNGYGIHLANATGFNQIDHNNLIGNTVQAYDDFIGDTLAATFMLFTAPQSTTYDVLSCTITRGGVALTAGTDYTVDNDTGLVTFLTTQTGQSGGVIISIKGVLTYEEYAPTIVKLPNDRLTDDTVTMTVTLTDKNGNVQVITPAYELYRKVGIIEITTPFKIERGVAYAVNYQYYNRTSLIPLALNVLTAESANFKFGNLSAEETELGAGIMPTWGVRAGQGTTLISGDRRYYYVNVPNQGMFTVTELANFFLYSELIWDQNNTDINLVIYGKGATSPYLPAAPYYMTKLGGSEEKAGFAPFTATGGPKDILMTNFNHEVLVICVSAKSFNGTNSATARFGGESGWLRMSDNNPKAWTNDVVGHAGVSFQSSVELPGISASIVGPAQGTKSVESIYQDDLTLYDLSTLEGWLTMNAVAGFTKVVTVKNALSWDVHIMGHPECVDLDLALFYDGKAGQPKDGIAQWQEIITNKDMQFDAYKDNYGSGSYCYCADADADEAIKIISPWDGDYIIKVLGYTVTTEPGLFDLEIKSIFAGVEGYKLSHTDTEFEDEDTSNSAYMNTEPVEGYDKRTFDVLWTFPEGTEDNVYGGIFVLGTPESPKLIVIAIDIILDREAPVLLPGNTGPNVIISTKTPTISAKIEDLVKGEIDPVGSRIDFDGQDITDICQISIGETKNALGVKGYWTGDIIYKPMNPLSEGGHFITVEIKDRAGNTNTISWGFTVDTIDPSLILNIPESEIYTSEQEFRLSGTAEPNSNIAVIGVQASISMHIDDTFDIDLQLEEGLNLIAIRSVDPAGNTYEETKSITLDTEAPGFRRVVALDGSTTNRRITGIYGELTEAGTLVLNGVPVPVNSDGTFRQESIMLVEGPNMQVLTFTDKAGNIANSYMNITLDTVAPTLTLDDIDARVSSEWLNITGTTESNVASLTVNGKLVDVQANGNFQYNIRLSYGVNNIVVESKDRAGNSVVQVMTAVYEAEAGTNYGAIGMIAGMLIVGLIVGLLLAFVIFGGRKEAVPTEDIPADETAVSEIPIEDEDLPEVPEDIPSEAEPIEPSPEELPPLPEEMPEPDVKADDSLEPIPPEESIPEATPPEAEDPRVLKLKEAYESGKISKELYEKNLARFKGQ